MSAYLWVPSGLKREEVPEKWWDWIDFDNQEIRFGVDGQGKKRASYVKIQCVHCGEEFWRAAKYVRRRIKQLGDRYCPACKECAWIGSDAGDKEGKEDTIRASIPEEWHQFIHWDTRKVQKRKMCVRVSCPECGEVRFVEILSLTDKHRKGLSCRKCTGRKFRGTPDRPARRRRLQEIEVNPEFRQYCHFDQQKVIEEASGHKLLHILVDCPMCGLSQWKRVSAIRSFGRPPFCRKCGGIQRRYFLKPESIRADWRPYIRCDSQQQRNGDSGPVMIQVECPVCHELRWMMLQSLRKMARDAPTDQLPNCSLCGAKRQRETGENLGVSKRGYVLIPLCGLSPKDRALAETMSTRRKKRSAVLEHRLVMARYLKRPLRPDEQVHHRNSDRTDNRLANLRLVTAGSHPVAPRDKIAYLSVEIEAAARSLQSADINPTGILERCLVEIKSLQPDALFDVEG